MRKLFMFVCFILSLLTMVAFTFVLNDLVQMFGIDLSGFRIEELMEFIGDGNYVDSMYLLGLALWGIFQLYGIPLAVFLISWNGLAIRSKTA